MLDTAESIHDDATGSASGSGHFLLRDRVFVAGVIVWVMSLLPSLFPIFGRDFTLIYAESYADLPTLMLVVFAAAVARRAAESGRERGFWALVIAFVLPLLVVRVMPFVMSEDVWLSTPADLLEDVLYVSSYLILAFALERRPDRAPVRGHRGRMQQIELLGGLASVFGLLIYFILIPHVFDPDVYASWVPSLLTYAVLDAYIALRLISILKGRVGSEWRFTYVSLAVAFGVWFVADLAEMGLYLEVIPWVDPGTPLDVIWLLPVLFLLVAVRGRRWSSTAASEQEPLDSVARLETLLPERTGFAVLVLALPTIHLVLGALDIREPALDGLREVLLLGVVTVVGALLIRHQRIMRELATSLDEDRRLVSDQLHISQRMEAVGRLATGVAHDFSNILSVVRGRAELLMMSDRVDAEGESDVREIVEASRRGQSLVTHLLTLGKRRPSEAEVHDLAAVIGDLQPLLERVLPHSVRVTFSAGTKALPIVHADRAHLEQVLLNLVVNARDAMPEGGTLRVHTAVVSVDDHFAVIHGGTKGGEYVLLSVADSGAGVPFELRHLVFEPFFTTKKDDLGTGLGLSIVYGVARQCNGFVRLTDARGGGAVFEVYLPRTGSAPTSASEARPQGGARGRETILLVEDYVALRKTAARVLEESGFKVLQAGTAAEALAILERRSERVELLLADLVLPDLSGLELQARALDRLPNLVTVFISGYPDGVTQLRMPDAATILEKPFSPEVLTFTIRRVLDERQRFFG